MLRAWVLSFGDGEGMDAGKALLSFSHNSSISELDDLVVKVPAFHALDSSSNPGSVRISKKVANHSYPGWANVGRYLCLRKGGREEKLPLHSRKCRWPRTRKILTLSSL